MEFDDLADDGEPQASAALVAGASFVEAYEPVENAGTVTGKNPLAIVVDDEFNAASLSGQRHRCPGARMPDGIVDQIPNDLAEKSRISVHACGPDGRAVQLDVAGSRAVNLIEGEVVEVDNLTHGPGALLEPGQQEERVDQALQALSLSQDDLSKLVHRHALGVKAGDLGMLVDRGQGRAKLV